MPYPTRHPSTYLMDAVADRLVGTSVVHDLMFPSWNSTPVSEDDVRIYRATVDFSRARNAAEVAKQLPRIYVAALVYANDWEQLDESASGEGAIWIHSLVPKERYLYGDQVDMAAAGALLSTPIVDARIIASDLYPVGQRREERESSFNDAWRFTSEFRVRNVGVLVYE